MTAPESVLNPAQAARVLLKEFQQKFDVFRNCLPLAIGIDKQLLAQIPTLDKKALRIALGVHTSSSRYLKIMAKASVRYDLDGKMSEEVTDVHRAHAARVLQDRFKKEAERRKALREAEEAENRRAAKLRELTSKFSRNGS
ncbi:MAG: ProQ/FINO family protein [Burkholderiaceae bacterium]